MTGETLIILLLALGIGLFVNYVIIKAAVSSAIEPMKKDNEEIIMLLRAIAEGQNAPVSKYEQIERDKAEIADLKRKLVKGFISDQERADATARIAELEETLK